MQILNVGGYSKGEIKMAKTSEGKNKVLFITITFLAVLMVLLAIIFISPLVFGKPYFVVYLANGEIYVGKASWFPRFYLTDVYLFQTGASTEGVPPGSNLQLVPLRDAPWSPKKFYFERDQIIFYGPIDEISRVAEALRGR